MSERAFKKTSRGLEDAKAIWRALGTVTESRNPQVFSPACLICIY